MGSNAETAKGLANCVYQLIFMKVLHKPLSLDGNSTVAVHFILL